MAKKRADGRYLKIITVKGKKYYVYGKNNKELFENEQKVREDIKRGIERRDNPTVFEYYERWLLGREGTVSKATIRTQDKIIKMLSKIEIDSLSRKFGDIKIKDVRIDDLRAVQNYLWQDRKSQTVNDYMSLVKHIFLMQNWSVLSITIRVTFFVTIKSLRNRRGIQSTERLH